MTVRSSSNEILIRYFPTASWTAGLLTVIVGCGLLFLIVRDRPVQLLSLGDLLNAVGLGLVIVAGSYLSFFDVNSHSGVFAAATEILIDSRGKFVQITRLRIYGRSVKRYRVGCGFDHDVAKPGSIFKFASRRTSVS